MSLNLTMHLKIFFNVEILTNLKLYFIHALKCHLIKQCIKNHFKCIYKLYLLNLCYIALINQTKKLH